MRGIIWDSINLALNVVWLVGVLVALIINERTMKSLKRSETTILNVLRERNSYTTTPIANKPSGLETPPPPATYAAYPSSQATPSKQIMSMQETQTHNSLQHTEDATPVGVTPPSPSHIHTGNRKTNKPNT